MPTYYTINEGSARAANMANSFRDYVPGSATAEYRSQVDKAAALVESRKAKLSPFYHDKLDSLLESYSSRLAAYYNSYYRNEASCPSVLISGGSNFPVNKKRKQNASRDTLMQEYNEVQGILDKIRSIGTGSVNLTDPAARQSLTAQLQREEKLLETCKAANAYYRKHKTLDGCPGISEKTAAHLTDSSFYPGGSPLALNGKPFPDYELTSIRGKIKRIQGRIAELDRLEAAAQAHADSLEFAGGEIVQNAELNRLQILFDDVPSPELRQELKSHGFRWSPANKAWQRQLTQNAMYDAKKILHIED